MYPPPVEVVMIKSIAPSFCWTTTRAAFKAVETPAEERLALKLNILLAPACLIMAVFVDALAGIVEVNLIVELPGK
jgi:hypothetical protein